MAAPPPVANVTAFLKAIQRSALLSADAMEKVRQQASDTPDPKQLARDLVRGGLLTRWQAAQLLHGYHALTIGKYKLLDELGAAPTGRLYLAEHAQMGRRHTLKVLARRLAGNPRAVKQFLASAQNACGLDHHNISHVYDVNQEGDKHYVVMEHVEGQNLEKLVERGGHLALAEALNYITQAAEGLAHAHDSGVVHGDLKPLNLLRDATGTIKILEIGQAGTGATFEAQGAEESIEMAALAAVIFQPPELRGDGQTPTIACDVYSLGSVLCFLLTGKAAADAAAAEKELREVGDVPDEVVKFCGRLMADKPADRPASMAAVIDELAAVAAALSTGTQKEISEAQPKAKKPPVAKSIDHEEQPVIIVGDDSPASVVSESIGPIVINPRGRKKPPAKSDRPPAKPDKPATTPNKEPDEASSAAESKPKPTYTPLILAGAIGAGGVLVIGLIIVLVWMLAFGRQEKPVAVSEKGQPAVASPAADVPASESNPAAPTTESNPEVQLAPSTNATVAAPSTTPSATNLAAATNSNESSASTATTATPPASPAKDEKTEPPPEPKSEPKTEPKTELKPASKPAPPKTTPKAPAKPEPFRGLASAVALPALPEAAGQPGTDALSPAVLGPCKLDEKTPLVVTLAGGEGAIRSSRQKFELEPQVQSPNQWDVMLTGGTAPVAIASLSAREGNLQFQWTEEAVKQAPLCRQLANCAVHLIAGSAQHTLALRTPVQGAPLVVEIDKAASVRWNIGELPIARQMFIEVTKLEEIKAHKQEPKGPVNVGESITVWTGVTEKSVPLGLKLNSSSTVRGVEVKLQPQVKLEGQDVFAYRRKEMENLARQVESEIPFLEQQLAQAKNDRPSRDPVKAAIEKKQIDDRKATLTVQLNQRAAASEQIKYLLSFTDTFQGTGVIHFRIFYQAGDAKVELLRTEEEPTAKTK